MFKHCCDTLKLELSSVLKDYSYDEIARFVFAKTLDGNNDENQQINGKKSDHTDPTVTIYTALELVECQDPSFGEA